MTDVYKQCPIIESDKYLLRLIEKSDEKDLSEVYSDKNALFNSDNCDGDNFYYQTAEKMQEAIKFWLYSYENRWFVRFTVIDKKTSKAIGTIELFNWGETDDDFINVGVLRLDVRSDHEKESVLFDIISLIIPSAYSLFDCTEIITKAPSYAIESISAIEKFGFKKSDGFLVGKYGTHDKYPSNEYWTVKK